jgi:hypothetical protein
MFDLSNLLQTIMAYNARYMPDLNTELDIGTRTEFYQVLREWSRDLPTVLRSEVNLTPSTSFSR